jgi:hypothetical protein
MYQFDTKRLLPLHEPHKLPASPLSCPCFIGHPRIQIRREIPYDAIPALRVPIRACRSAGNLYRTLL